jgi:hypothetical protein
MYCSTCGVRVPSGGRICSTCGSPSAPLDPWPLTAGYAELEKGPVPALNQAPIAVCPRCDYQGQGLPYFSRGPHMAGLVAAALLTLPYALGAGGFIYYGLRYDHRVCPRCGFGWGKRAVGGLPARVESRAPLADVSYPAKGAEGLMRVWSIMLFVLSAILFVVGVADMEGMLIGFSVLSAGGGLLLRRSANRTRARRREALLAALQMRVLKLAGERQGRLTVTDVAASLGWPLRRAEKVLHSLDDGWRVDSEVTDDGVIVYEFRELLLGRER